MAIIKMTAAARNQLIFETLCEIIKAEQTGWMTTILPHIEKMNIIGNGKWMQVRGVMQWAMNEGYLARAPFDPTADDEYYVRLDKAL